MDEGRRKTRKRRRTYERYISERDAVCPFIRRRTKKSLSCEGPIPGTTCKTAFSKEQEQETQYRIFCCDQWEKCEIARAVKEKYDDE